MFVISACPYGLRRIAAWSTPGGSMSSTYDPIPRSSRGSSCLRNGADIHSFRSQPHGAHEHARGAEAALQAVGVPECLLHRMQLFSARAVGQTFDSRDAGAVRLN